MEDSGRKGSFPFVTRLLQLRLLGLLLVDQRLLLALFSSSIDFCTAISSRVFFNSAIVSGGPVEIAEIDLHPLIALALFTAEHHLDAGMRPRRKAASSCAARFRS